MSERKIVLITGANKGLGFALVEQIVARYPDTHVVLGSRNMARGTAAWATLPVEAQPRVSVVEINVEDESSVAAAAAFVAASFPGEMLYGLVNNAGVYDSENLAAINAVNVFGIKHVCDAFFPLLHSTDGRVVNVTSAAGPMHVAKCGAARVAQFTDYNVTWPQLETLVAECVAESAQAGAADAYYVSKALANTLTLFLAKANPNLVITSCTPGFLETDMTRPMALKAGKSPADMGMKSVAQGTVSTLHLLFADEIKALPRKGYFFGSDAKRSPLHEYRAPEQPPYDGP